MRPLLFFLLLTTIISCNTEDKEIKNLEFFEGKWKGDLDGEQFTETWQQTDSGLIGSAASYADGDTTFSEKLLISNIDNEIYYQVELSDKNSYRFKLTESTDHKATFEDKLHDFPQSICYEKKSNDTLLVTLKGKEEGKDQQLNITLTRYE